MNDQADVSVSALTLRGFPRGWFVIATSDELRSGNVRPLRYFGEDFVLYRTESGKAVVHDAFCPHLGAHLGHGGVVEGESIRCPFHAWRFDCSGACDEVPYAKKIPPKARVATHPVVERNGLIFMWNANTVGEAPTWEIPTIEEWGAEGWTEWNASLFTIRTHPKEIVENLADKAHFGPVHGTWVTEFDNAYDGHIGIQRARGTAYPRGGGEDPFSLTSTYYGPGYMLTRMKSYLPNILLLAHTPVDMEHVHVRIGAMIDLSNVKKGRDVFSQKYQENIVMGFKEDIAIWENKVYRERPNLCDGDGDLGSLRRWYTQFYRPEAGVATQRVVGSDDGRTRS